MIKNNKVVGIRISSTLKNLLFEYSNFKSEQAGYAKPLSTIINENMFEIMKNDVEFNKYLEKREGKNE